MYEYIREKDALKANSCKFYGAAVILVIEYLHKKGFVYRDLKPENLLIAFDGYLKFVDFGFSKLLNSNRTFTICGTPEYIAPEIILNKGHGMAVDWWALGILIYEMHAGIDPFSDEDPILIYKKILKRKIVYPANFDPEIADLVNNLLQTDLSKRYGNLKDGNNFSNNEIYRCRRYQKP